MYCEHVSVHFDVCKALCEFALTHLYRLMRKRIISFQNNIMLVTTTLHSLRGEALESDLQKDHRGGTGDHDSRGDDSSSVYGILLPHPSTSKCINGGMKFNKNKEEKKILQIERERKREAREKGELLLILLDGHL